MKAPYNTSDSRMKIKNKLESINGISIDENRINKRPSFELDMLSGEADIKCFVDVFKSIVEDIKNYDELLQNINRKDIKIGSQSSCKRSNESVDYEKNKFEFRGGLIKKWRKFEETVCEIQKNISGNSDVKFDYKVKGKLTNISRQVDIALFTNVGSYQVFIAIECKDHSRKVDISTVESFAQKIKDLGAHVGVLISSNGFTKSAISLAKQSNIETKRLIDEGNNDYRINIKLPVLYQFKEISSYNLYVRNLSQEDVKLNTDEYNKIMIYDENSKELGNVNKLLNKCWNQQTEDVTEGVHTYEISKVKLMMNDIYRPCDIKIVYEVSVLYYKYWIKFDEFKGFLDESTDKINVAEFKTEAMEFSPYKNAENQVSKDEFQSDTSHLVLTYLKDFKIQMAPLKSCHISVEAQ